MIATSKSNHSIVIVGRRIRVESELRVTFDNGISASLDLAVHSSASGNRHTELGDTRRNVEGLR